MSGYLEIGDIQIAWSSIILALVVFVVIVLVFDLYRTYIR